MRRSVRFLILLAVLCLRAVPAFAQTDAGALRVFVTDATQGAIPGATVDVINASTNDRRTVVTDGTGYAYFVPVVRGTYTVTIALPGFKSVEVANLRIDVNERRFLPVTLQVASATETVKVVSKSAAIQTEDGSIGQVIQGPVAVELPLQGRRYTELALLVPGTAPTSQTLETRGPGWFVSNGNYQTQNNFTLDGFDNNQGTTNAQSLSTQVVQPSPDAIGEFKVQTNSFSAEFGRSAGAVINVSLKSGTNSIGGSAFYYNRDKALANKSWLAEINGLPKEDLQWNQFGGTLGGPLRKDSTFYFGSYEGFKRTFSNSFVTTVPTLEQKKGNFASTIIDPRTGLAFANNSIPQNRWDPLGAKLLALFPDPNQAGRAGTGGRTIENYAVQRDGNELTSKIDLRLDHKLTSSDRVMVRYSFLQQAINRDAIFPGLADGVGNQGEQYNRNNSVGVTWTKVIGSRMVNEARLGYNRTNARFAHATANDQTASAFGFIGMPDFVNTTGGLPLIDLSNYNDLGTRNFRPQFQTPQQWQFVDTLTRTFGTHSVRMGGEMRFKDNRFADITRRTPAYVFSGAVTNDDIADLLLGQARSMSATTAPIIDWRQQAYSAFVQDDWKVSPYLTLNLGLRYEYGTPYYGAGENKNVNFDFATGQLVFPSSNDKYLIDPDRNNFGPRLGFAWQALPERMVVRGGFGVFYSIEDMRGSEGVIALNPPSLVQTSITGTGSRGAALGLSDPFPANLLNTFVPSTVSVKAQERNQQAATVYQWNLATQFMLPWKTTFELAYVGNAGRHLLANLNVNTPVFGLDGSVAANRPFPGWSQIGYNISESQSMYHALQAKLEHRMSSGFYTLASYTFAKAEDETGAWDTGNGVQAYIAPDLSNARAALAGERGPNSQFPKHRFTLSEVWEIPVGRGRAIGADMNQVLDAFIGGWQLSTIWTARTGLPVNVSLATSGTDPITGRAYSFLNRNGGVLRPNMVGDPNAHSDAEADRLHFLDPAAYSLQAVNTPGNAPRNSAWGPGYFTIDMSLVKRFRIGGNRSADVRFEAFNVLNRTNYQNPNGTWGSSSFGAITGAYDKRVVQMALRVAF